MKYLALIAFVYMACACTAREPVRLDRPRAQNIFEYTVTLEPDLTRAWVRGEESVRFDKRLLPANELVFTANALRINAATIDGVAVETRVEGQELRISVPETRPRGEYSVLKISFEGAPARGYELKDGAIITSYFACQWMICAQDSFGDKAWFSLDLVLLRKMTTIGPGTLNRSGELADGRFHALWHAPDAYSSYLYAFAVGDFKTTTHRAGKLELRFAGAASSDAELDKLFEPTADMVAFFEKQSGAPFPQRQYTQLLVDGNAAQEAVSHSIIGRRALEPRLTDPTDDWVIAHELAHQWWGNSITCTELSEFWLNEGVTTFMVAAWKEHRWGRAAYERELDLARQRLASAVAQWRDVPLTFHESYPSLGVRRAIQYSKGQLFLDALRTELGDEAFWAAFKSYTVAHLGKTVTSRDFQTAFEKSSGRDLSKLFDEWVY